jgi:Uma2 family endonuclease
MSTVATPAVELLAATAHAPVAVTAQPELTKVHVPIMIDGEVLIPGWVIDLESFRRWAHSDEFPTRGRVSFIDGMIWLETAMEEFYFHNQVKRAYNDTLSPLIRAANNGYYVPDGCLWTHAGADISTEADAMFFTFEALKTGRIRHVEGKKGGDVELEGTPEMTLEIVSDSSVKKDTIILKDKCANAGVAEYWLVDARREEPSFQIWRLHEGSYLLADNDNGWLKSSVFGKAFKLDHAKDELGKPQFELRVRE